MIDPRILQALEQNDPTLRKKAVAALGKSNSPEALAILAKVYRNDSDPEVKELARKAGVYLKKQIDEGDARPASKPTRPAEPDALSPEAMIAAAHANKQAEAIAKEEQIKEDKRKENPLYMKVMEADLENIKLSGMQKKKFEMALEQAMDYSMKKEPMLANEELRKAFAINPGLREDAYARSLVLQIVGGRDEDQAIETVLKEKPLAQQKEATTKKRGGNIFGLFQLIAGLVMFAGFFMPWINFNLDNVENTRTKMQYSGSEILANIDGSAMIFTSFTPETLIQLNQGNYEAIEVSRDPISFSPLLLTAAGGMGVAIGLSGLLGGTRRGYGFQGILSSIIGASSLVWLYTSQNNMIARFEEQPELGFVPQVALESGFYLGVAGVFLAFVVGVVIFLRG